MCPLFRSSGRICLLISRLQVWDTLGCQDSNAAAADSCCPETAPYVVVIGKRISVNAP